MSVWYEGGGDAEWSSGTFSSTTTVTPVKKKTIFQQMGLFFKKKETAVVEPVQVEPVVEDVPVVQKTKREYKNEAKALVGKKFVVGKTYMLRQKGICGSKDIIKKYILKKFIYTSKDAMLNILIMKQTDGNYGSIFCLDKDACQRYHIKYEPGLQVFSMELNWIPCKQ